MIHANWKQKKEQFEIPDLSFDAGALEPEACSGRLSTLLTTCNSRFYFRTLLFIKLQQK